MPDSWKMASRQNQVVPIELVVFERDGYGCVKNARCINKPCVPMALVEVDA
eukprot:SAG31_NODE_6045_length_2193_cov_0.862942_2_plen_51_part_00